MGEIILNGKSYNSGMKYKEVTQAEYNALPSSKLTDGTLYCITDAPGPGEGFPPMIYSYEEREVGVWVNGKPLYQKTIILDSLITDGNWNSVAHNISNVEKFIKIDSVAFRNIEDTNFIYMPVPTRNETANIDFNIGLRVNLTNIDYIIVRYSTEIENIIVNLQYTKTTDAAGAGTWLPDGTQAHHYSTDEHIIGTWIDGKPLYEKTVSFTAGSTAYDHQQILNILDADNYFVEKAYVINSSGYLTPMQGYTASQGSDEFCGTVGNITGVGLRLEYRVGSNNYGASGIIVVRYTKIIA